jgi:hypothetical protein
MDGRLDLRRDVRNGTAATLICRPGKAPPDYIGTPYDNPEDLMTCTKNGLWWFTWSSHKEGACYRLDDACDEEGMLGSSLHDRFIRDG